VKWTRRSWWCTPALLAPLFLLSLSAGGAAPARAQRTTGPVAPSALVAPLVSVRCSTSQKCVAIGSGSHVTDCIGGGCSGSISYAVGARTSDGGAHWSSTPVLRGVGTLNAMTCATARTCIAVGDNLLGNTYQGVAIRTGDGGRTWMLLPGLPRRVGVLSSVSCPTSTFCMAVGASRDGASGVALTTTTGRDWRIVPLPKSEKSLGLVTCTSRRHCIVVGGGQSGFSGTILTTADGGSTWRQSPFATGTGPVGIPHSSAIACPIPTRCFIVGDATPGDGSPSGYILTSATGGQSWTYERLPSGTTSLNAISCATSNDCVVVGGGFEARRGLDRRILTTTDGGQTWISRPVPKTFGGLNSVSCATTTVCVASGFVLTSASASKVQPSVFVTTDGGMTWTELH
jgi:photosystem II stability/assembly factor-like uncharacterized protein